MATIPSPLAAQLPAAPRQNTGIDSLLAIAAGRTPSVQSLLAPIPTRVPLMKPMALPGGAGLPALTPSAPTLPTPQMPSISVQGKVTPKVKGAVNLVQEYLGTPYVWGGENPGGFDCSGLIQYVWGKQGVDIPRTTYDQFKAGTPVDKNNLQAGDAVFFTGSDPMNGLPGHVGMYLGGGKFIEAPHTGADVRISDLAGRTDFVGARRYAA